MRTICGNAPAFNTVSASRSVFASIRGNCLRPLDIMSGTAKPVVQHSQGRRDFHDAVSVDRTVVAAKGNSHADASSSTDAGKPSTTLHGQAPLRLAKEHKPGNLPVSPHHQHARVIGIGLVGASV
jgi:hypothetical protein